MSRVYLDACSIIYLHEASSSFHQAITKTLKAYQDDPNAVLLTSRLSRLECRIKPMREEDAELLAMYDKFFDSERLIIKELTAAVIERATEHRARLGFKTPDAIHTASAVEAKADIFITGDVKLERCTELHVEILKLNGESDGE